MNGSPIAVTGSQDGSVGIWNLATGQPIGNPLTGHTNAVSTVACTSLNGHPIAATASDDHTARVWDLTTGQPIGNPLPFTSHTSRVHSVACTRLNGHPIAVTASGDNTVRIWDLATMTCVDALTIASHHLAVEGERLVIITGSDIAVLRQTRRSGIERHLDYQHG